MRERRGPPLITKIFKKAQLRARSENINPLILKDDEITEVITLLDLFLIVSFCL